MLFGKPVYPEDYFTESKGYKVYLTWSVPNPAERRPMNSLNSKSLYHKVKDSVITRHTGSYTESVIHVNQLYNKVFGIEKRKVPAHVPHLIDVDIMTRLQNTFAHHFDITSSHKIRSSNDMQFEFAYDYFLMSELKLINLSDIFDNFDADNTGYETVCLTHLLNELIILF